MTVELPRHVLPKRLKSGATAFYYNVPSRYRALKCPVPSEALGTDFAAACEKAKTLNGLFDEWDLRRKGQPIDTPSEPKFGTVDWLFREYKQSLAYTKKVAPRSRKDYEWAMSLLCDTLTKQGDRVGSRPVRSITPRGADKLYEKIVIVPEGKRKGKRRDRTGEKVVKLCRKAWRVIHRLHPDQFDKAVPNPWLGVTLESRVKAKKPAVTREQVYQFARGAIELGEVEIAAVCVICFEWLQRPENVIAGHITWNDYRSPAAPTTIRVAHHKTGTVAPHPLETVDQDGTVVKFYADAEEILAALPRRGIPMILRQVDESAAKPFAFVTMEHKVQRLRKRLGLPSHFTMDACRHGGMTELEEAELTDGQGRALSTHKTQQSYEGYAKRTAKRMLSATRKRHAHRLAAQAAANGSGTSVQNEAADSVQNGKSATGGSG